MITIKGKYYSHDYDQKDFVKTFNSLDALESYLKNNIADKKNLDIGYGAHSGNPYLKLKHPLDDRHYDQWIYLIETSVGILMSTGDYTNGQAHTSSLIKDMFSRLTNWKQEQYNFID